MPAITISSSSAAICSTSVRRWISIENLADRDEETPAGG
jgi:hypothetical protein